MATTDRPAAQLNEALAAIEQWPVDVAGAGVTDAATTLATHGAVDTVLELASVTKPLTAYAVLIAAQDGVLHLDEPVTGDHVPENATVRHLLAHASGLPPEPDMPTVAPGRLRVYSNWGYDLLGDLVADRVGLPFADHLAVEVLKPLDMTATVLEGSPASAARGTVGDLLAFARELLEPTLLDPDLHREATSVAFPGLDGVVPGFGRQTPNDWGLGVEVKSTKRPHWTGETLSPATFGHFGLSGSQLWVDPERGIATVSLADREFGDWAREAWPAFNDRLASVFDG